MKKIIKTKSYVLKKNSQSKDIRYWGEISVKIFIPEIPIKADVNNSEAWDSAYKDRDQKMRDRAEKILQQAQYAIDNLPLPIQVNEGSVKGTDTEVASF